MFGIGFQEMLIILVVVLIFFGPKRLPDLAKSLGKGIAEFKKASDEVRKGIEDAVKEESAPKEGHRNRRRIFPRTGRPRGALPRLRCPQAEPAPSTGAPATAEGAAPGTATGETPVPPPRQG